MKKMVFFLLIVTFLSSAVLSLGCRTGVPDSATEGKVNITTSFYPLFEAARQVGGDKASVSSLVPAGTEPHEFEPTPRDISGLSKAKIVVYNGAGLEP